MMALDLDMLPDYARLSQTLADEVERLVTNMCEMSINDDEDQQMSTHLVASDSGLELEEIEQLIEFPATIREG